LRKCLTPYPTSFIAGFCPTIVAYLFLAVQLNGRKPTTRIWGGLNQSSVQASQWRTGAQLHDR
jgi:hypothetical protein